MFEPKFNYTYKIVNNLVEITSARELILNAYLVPKWEISLRREALIRAAHASTAIEGNPLSLEEVSKLAQGRKVTATRRAKQWEGKYRDIQVYVGNKITGEIIFTPPPSKEVPILMEEFLTWFDRTGYY